MGTSPAGKCLMGADSGIIYKQNGQPLREQGDQMFCLSSKGKKDNNIKSQVMEYSYSWQQNISLNTSESTAGWKGKQRLPHNVF